MTLETVHFAETIVTPGPHNPFPTWDRELVSTYQEHLSDDAAELRIVQTEFCEKVVALLVEYWDSKTQLDHTPFSFEGCVESKTLTDILGEPLADEVVARSTELFYKGPKEFVNNLNGMLYDKRLLIGYQYDANDYQPIEFIYDSEKGVIYANSNSPPPSSSY